MQSISVWPLSWKGSRALSSTTTARSSAEITAHLCRRHGDSVARVETPNFAFESGNVSFCWTFDFSQIGLIIQLTHFRRSFRMRTFHSFTSLQRKRKAIHTHTHTHSSPPMLFLVFICCHLTYHRKCIPANKSSNCIPFLICSKYYEMHFLARR